MVSFTKPERVAAYLERYPLPFPVVSDPERSILLLKPSLQMEHGGGERLPAGSREYHLLKRPKNSWTVFQVCSGCSIHGMCPHLLMNVRVEFLISRCASQIFASPAKSCRPCRSKTGAVIALSFGRKSKFPSALRKAGTTRKLKSLGLISMAYCRAIPNLTRGLGIDHLIHFKKRRVTDDNQVCSDHLGTAAGSVDCREGSLQNSRTSNSLGHNRVFRLVPITSRYSPVIGPEPIVTIARMASE